jgi:hypothetical protein
MQVIKVLTGQTVCDVALLHTGDISSVIEILELNPDIELDTKLQPGQLLKVGDVISSETVAYYNEENIAPASALNFDVKSYLELINNKMTTQELDHTITQNVAFQGVKLDNLYKNLTIQLTYALTQNVTAYVEQSLDGVSYDPIPGADQVLDKTKTSHTFNFVDLLTNYVRVRIEAPTASGVIEKITYLV